MTKMSDLVGGKCYVIRGWVMTATGMNYWSYVKRVKPGTCIMTPFLSEAMRFNERRQPESYLKAVQAAYVNDPQVLELIVKEPEPTESTVSRSIVV